MKVVIFGSRRIASYAGQPKDEQRRFTDSEIRKVFTALYSFKHNLETGIYQNQNTIEEVVCGMAKEGGDMLGKVWAEFVKVPIKEFPANWAKYGKAAGHIRNKQMASYADFGVGIWDGFSSGTKNMIKELEAHDKNYVIWPVGNLDRLGMGVEAQTIQDNTSGLE